MKEEIQSAVDFLTNILRSKDDVNEAQTRLFNTTLSNLLCNRYQNHWFPEKPFKGSGYRCIRLNHNMDPLILQAGQACGLNLSSLETTFPPELTVWVDPRDVSYRIGENGSVGVLYESNVTAQNQQHTSQPHDLRMSPVQNLRTSPVQDYRTSPVQDYRTSPIQDYRTSPVQDFRTSPVHHQSSSRNLNSFMSCKDQFMNVLPSIARDSVSYQHLAGFVAS